MAVNELEPRNPARYVVAERDATGTTLTIHEAAKRAEVSVTTMRRWLMAGKVEGAYKTGGPEGEEWRIPAVSLLVAIAPMRKRQPVAAVKLENETLKSKVAELEHKLEQARAEKERLETERQATINRLLNVLERPALGAGDLSSVQKSLDEMAERLARIEAAKVEPVKAEPVDQLAPPVKSRRFFRR